MFVLMLYCVAYLTCRGLGREVAIVNLDPANQGERLVAQHLTSAVRVLTCRSLTCDMLLLQLLSQITVQSRRGHRRDSFFAGRHMLFCISCYNSRSNSNIVADAFVSQAHTALTAMLICILDYAQGAMDSFGLGPNGGIIYCLEYLEQNLDWLQEKLDVLGNKYIIIDFPGQVNTFAYVIV
jgi:hypothetical protein